jgi:hypothetical protein
MSKIPPAMMMTKDKHVNPAFPSAEYLYRRIPLSLWGDAGAPLDVNAIELPDLSCGRSKYGHPEWLGCSRRSIKECEELASVDEATAV